MKLAFIIALLLLSNSASADKLTVAISASKPPYVYQEDGKLTGFEVELMQRLMARMGYQLEFRVLPFATTMKMLKDPNIDGIMTASPLVFKDKSVITKPYISYKNVALTLTKNQIAVTEVPQLGKYSLASFQLASRVLGAEFEKASKQSPKYLEVSQQAEQLDLLKTGEVSALVIDENIFSHLKPKDYPAVTVSELFDANLYGLALKDPAFVKLFNRVWLSYKKSEEYQALKRKYKMVQHF